MAEDAIEEKGLPIEERYAPVVRDRRVPHIPNETTYNEMYRNSIENREEFWNHQAKSLRWINPHHTMSIENFPLGDVRWFVGGKLNVVDNCLDRWAEKYPDRVAIIHEGDEPSQVRKITYAELLRSTCRIANLLQLHGVCKGDRVTIYLSMVPELAMAMFACARIGAVHSVVFAGFSAVALRDRLVDAQSSVVVTLDIGVRAGKNILLKSIMDDALQHCPFVKTCLVFRHGEDNPEEARSPLFRMMEGRDVWADDAAKNMKPYCPCEAMDSEDPLFMLYTSGSTGTPKGVVHTTAGYLLYASLTHKYVFDHREGDVYACMADCGWITGHSYILYGPLCNGATTFMFESVPTYPDCGRYWDMVERHKITQFYTAPTALRALMRHEESAITKYDRSSLRILGCVGEPINPEVWRWYYNVIGNARCPIVDTFWQTETGGFVITPLPFAFNLKPGSATRPFFGIEPVVVDALTGAELKGNNVAGLLCFRRSWPGMMRTIWNDHERMLDIYFRPYPGLYLTGDGCVRDKDGYYWITGRVDDVINVSGHRIGSAEVEHALVQHVDVAEAAVVACAHDIKGQGIFCFVTLKIEVHESSKLIIELKERVRTDIGPIATPDVIVFTAALPKTRSGKIMRRILRKIAMKEESLGDTSTLADATVIDDLIRCIANLA